MEVEFQNSREDFIDFYRIKTKDRLKQLSLFFLIFLVVIIIVCSGDPFKWTACIIISFIYVCLVVGYFYFFTLWRAIKTIDNGIDKEPTFAEKRKIIIDEDGLKTVGKDNDVLRSWGSVIAVNSNKRFVYIILVDNRVLIIAKKWFSSDVEIGNFMGSIRSKLINPNERRLSPFPPTKDQSQQYLQKNISPYYSKPKPPYLLGLLGVIPLVGAFVGVALILYGIIKYKDKWLVLIGTGGILFTVLIYGSLFYTANNSKIFKSGFEKIDSMQLNSLVKEIEFYKINNGSYPDSLAQLDIKDSFTSTSDPLLNGKKNDKYNYHKVGGKYTLFSSGEDKTPNTPDDIYPTVDTTNTGLIVKRR